MTTTKPSTTPSTDQSHDEVARGTKGARGRSSSKGIKARTGGIDPLPDYLGNADEASIATTLWTISVTMWPRAGNETSLTSSAAIGRLKWVF